MQIWRERPRMEQPRQQSRDALRSDDQRGDVLRNRDQRRWQGVLSAAAHQSGAASEIIPEARPQRPIQTELSLPRDYEETASYEEFMGYEKEGIIQRDQDKVKEQSWQAQDSSPLKEKEMGSREVSRSIDENAIRRTRKQAAESTSKVRRSQGSYGPTIQQKRLRAIEELPAPPVLVSSPLPTPRIQGEVKKRDRQAQVSLPLEEKDMEYAQDYRVIRGNNVNNVVWVGSDEWGEQTVEQKEAVMQRKGAPLVKVGAQEEQQEEGGLGAFFTSLVDGASALIDGAVAVISEPVEALVPAILGAALLPVLGPIVAVPAAVGAAALMTAIGDAAKTTGIREETVEKLVKPLREEQLDGSEPQSEDAEEQFEESELQDEDLKQQFMEANLDRVIREVLSKDRQANEDLKQFFTRLVPDIQKAIKVAEKARETNIKIEGPVQGLIVGEHNDITQTFRGLLSGEN